jgi:hypothetical protein
MEFVGNSPDLKKALAHPVKPKGGPRAVVGNAGGCRNSHQLCEATAADLAVLGSLRQGDPEGRQDRQARGHRGGDPPPRDRASQRRLVVTFMFG